ncbi:MAG: DUF6263 family protein [Ginsengibacter sp.]
MIKNTLLLSAGLIVSAIGICQNPGKLLLNNGEKYSIENKFTVTSKQDMMGQSIDSKIDFFTLNNMEVKEVKDNNYNLAATYTKITASMNAMGQDMNFDSDKKEDMNGEMGSGFKDIIGQAKNVVVDKNGKILIDKKDTNSEAGQGGMMSMMMKQLMGDQDETGFGLSEVFMIIPVKSTVGSSWGDSTSMGGIKKSAIYTIKEIKGTEAVVTISGILDMDIKTEMQGTEIINKSTGKLSGEEVVDIKTGLVKQRNTTLESSGKVVAMGQEIPTTTKVNKLTTLKRL